MDVMTDSCMVSCASVDQGKELLVVVTLDLDMDSYCATKKIKKYKI
jgi:hypothetical protein